MTTAATSAPWRGWTRRPGRRNAWRPIVEAASEAEAWQLLLARAEGGDSCVLPADRDPNEKAAPVRLDHRG